MNPAGFGFCQPDDPELDDVYVSARGVGSAMHGDRVLVRVGRGRDDRPRGRVVRVLAHGLETLTAVFRGARGHGVLVPQDPRI
ncbi:MAG TPA: ribonuclease R, partial [Candidatus Binatia bacterium]|nr:ribonuclease R [Candidatus Binatia bacterium]